MVETRTDSPTLRIGGHQTITERLRLAAGVMGVRERVRARLREWLDSSLFGGNKQTSALPVFDTCIH